jgi:sporulation protein YlmC with PRC-barrel domain
LETAKKGILALNITAFRWKNAPAYRNLDPSALNGQRGKQINQFYGGPPRRETSSAQVTIGHPGTSLEPTGPDGRRSGTPLNKQYSGAAGMQLASDIIGQEVVNRQQQTMGEVSDLLVDLSGQKPTLAIISGSRLLKQEANFAVPLASLTITNGGKVLINASPAMFEQAQPFDEKAWQTAAATSTGKIYRFER